MSIISSGDFMSNKEIKTFGKNLIKKRRIKAVTMSIILITVTALFTFAGYLSNSLISSKAVLIAIISVLSATVLIFQASFSLGEKAWYSGKLSKNKSCIKRFIFWFNPKYSLKAFSFGILLFLIKFFWTVTLLLPGIAVLSSIIILAYTGGIELYLFISLSAGFIILFFAGLIFRFLVLQRYFLAPHLLSSNPKLKPLQAIRQSKNILDGHIMEIVKFKLSFLPSFLSCIFIVPLIYFVPYYKQSCCVIAKSICV